MASMIVLGASVLVPTWTAMTYSTPVEDVLAREIYN
jgi:hypothetical protein